MTQVNVSLPQAQFGQTSRRDRWWVTPLITFLVLGGFVVYATWAALQGNNYRWGPYLSPFYSPEIYGDAAHAWLGVKPGWWPGWLIWSPAIVILWAPGFFRLTCYYYRGAYYKGMWADPPSCAVGEPRKRYRGEAKLPLILQNSHRFFLYLALVFLVILASDVWRALWFDSPATGRTQFGIGIGTLVLALNVIFLGGYTFGCHSLRHLVGGGIDLLSAAAVRDRMYRCVNCFNRRHMSWAWLSLIWVAFSDIYVRMLAMGVWSDWRLL
ncbi:MAG TPA: succinate dehydrogenase [Phycisphaerae bacterium]|jgi:hypothetical protein